MKAPDRPQDKIIIALDVPGAEEALRLLDRLGEPPAFCKIGLELFSACGPSIVRAVMERGSKVFLDLKFHDIPNTAAHAVRSAVGLGVAMTTLHASGGPVMLEAAAKAAEGSDILLLAVTVLTSMDEGQLSATGIPDRPVDQVLRLASLASEAGIGGLVCSPLEIAPIRAALGSSPRIVTPGVRPTWAVRGDQKRVMTPGDAVKAGADWLVIGRPVTGAPDTAAAYARVVAEVS